MRFTDFAALVLAGLRLATALPQPDAVGVEEGHADGYPVLEPRQRRGRRPPPFIPRSRTRACSLSTTIVSAPIATSTIVSTTSTTEIIATPTVAGCPTESPCLTSTVSLTSTAPAPATITQEQTVTESTIFTSTTRPANPQITQVATITEISTSLVTTTSTILSVTGPVPDPQPRQRRDAQDWWPPIIGDLSATLVTNPWFTDDDDDGPPRPCTSIVASTAAPSTILVTQVSTIVVSSPSTVLSGGGVIATSTVFVTSTLPAPTLTIIRTQVVTSTSVVTDVATTTSITITTSIASSTVVVNATSTVCAQQTQGVTAIGLSTPGDFIYSSTDGSEVDCCTECYDTPGCLAWYYEPDIRCALAITGPPVNPPTTGQCPNGAGNATLSIDPERDGVGGPGFCADVLTPILT